MKPFAIGAAAVLILAVAAVVGYQAIGPINIPRGGGLPAEIHGSLTGFSVPAGFSMSLYADGLPDARAMEFGPTGELLVSQPSEGSITAVLDRDGDGKAETKTVVVSGLNLPHGFALRCADSCDLYVAETDALSVWDYDPASLTASKRRELLELPSGGARTHVTRSLAFMPYPNEDTLLVSIGSSCNVCDESDPRRASVLAYDVSTGESREFARGLRNAVFMTPHPVTGDIWSTEMGRDGLGDDIPPDEVNILRDGANYGWPACYGKNVHDTDFDTKTYIRNPCMEPFETPSHVDIPAHSAPLGIAFVPEEGWDEDMWYDALVAYHGSWNRSVPTGYKVVRMKLDAQGAYEGAEDFITGWLRPDGTKVGRPADVKALPGGVVYISDDDAGVVYRVTRR